MWSKPTHSGSSKHQQIQLEEKARQPRHGIASKLAPTKISQQLPPLRARRVCCGHSTSMTLLFNGKFG